MGKKNRKKTNKGHAEEQLLAYVLQHITDDHLYQH